MKAPIARCMLLLLILSACAAPRRIYISDNDFVQESRQYSPDRAMLILDYKLDIGALGYSDGGTAVLRTSDLAKDLTQFSLPDNLQQAKWIDNETISARIDVIPYIRNDEEPPIRDIEVNGVKVKVAPYDHIEDEFHMETEHREASPDGKYELVAYRYCKDRSSLNFIHISVIQKGEKVPKYGNYYIADMSSDRILYGGWTKDNTLVFYSNSMYADHAKYFFVRNRPNIKCEIIADDKRFAAKYRWTALY
jgi:hypothetical protein